MAAIAAARRPPTPTKPSEQGEEEREKICSQVKWLPWTIKQLINCSCCEWPVQETLSIFECCLYFVLVFGISPPPAPRRASSGETRDCTDGGEGGMRIFFELQVVDAPERVDRNQQKDFPSVHLDYF